MRVKLATASDTVRLGIVCGLARERRCLVRAWTGPSPGLRVAMGAAAAAAARDLIAGGATHLVSFGMAGGLDPALPPGALVVPDAVGDGADDLPLVGVALRAALPARGGRLLSVAAPLLDLASKGRAAALGFVAVDMETHAVARVAAAAGLACLAVRAIADPALRPLPRVARVAVGPDGRLRPAAMAWALLSRPDQWPLVRAVAADARAAEASLGRAAATLARLAGQGCL